MLRIAAIGLFLIGSAVMASTESQAQVVTSYYAPTAVSPVYGTAVVGSVPVRQGLFGLRRGYIPVLAPTAVTAPVIAAPVVAAPVVAAPAVTTPPYAASYPYQAAYPYQASYPYQAAYRTLPSTVVQSGYRGYNVAPLPYTPTIAAPTIAAPVITAPVTSFYPSAVMSMQ